MIRDRVARLIQRAVATHRPLGRAGEPYAWVSETTIAPWVICVLASGEAAGSGAGVS